MLKQCHTNCVILSCFTQILFPNYLDYIWLAAIDTTLYFLTFLNLNYNFNLLSDQNRNIFGLIKQTNPLNVVLLATI